MAVESLTVFNLKSMVSTMFLHLLLFHIKRILSSSSCHHTLDSQVFSHKGSTGEQNLGEKRGAVDAAIGDEKYLCWISSYRYYLEYNI